MLSGQVVVVTGAASGIGEATVRLLAQHGALVIALDRDSSPSGTTHSESVAALRLQVNVADSQLVDRSFRAVIKRFGRIDGLVHAAGVDDPQTKQLVAQQVEAGLPVDTIADLTDQQWHRMISTNLDGAFYVLRSALQSMRAQGSGAAVMIGSETGARGLAGLGHYGASKGGVHALVRSAAKEAAAYGVRVNGIAPGVIDTPMSRRSAGVFGGTAPLAPIGRAGQPEEIAQVALFLLSSLASYVVGEVINVDGGRLAC